MSDKQEVTKTILDQLGGERFALMTGAKDFVTLGNKCGLGFKVRGGQYVRIVLNSMDTYDIERFKMRNMERIKLRTEKGVYNDMLQCAFTRLTGLETHL